LNYNMLKVLFIQSPAAGVVTKFMLHKYIIIRQAVERKQNQKSNFNCQ